MLGTYAIGARYGMANDRSQTELGRYVRSEYGATTSVEAFLAGAIEGARHSRTNRGQAIVSGIRALVKALGALGRSARAKGRSEEA